jgi:hypothetical protein
MAASGRMQNYSQRKKQTVHFSARNSAEEETSIHAQEETRVDKIKANLPN